jgi:hypothetical protein
MRSAGVRLVQQQFNVTLAEFYLKFNCVTRKSVLPHRKHSVSITKNNLHIVVSNNHCLLYPSYEAHERTAEGLNITARSANSKHGAWKRLYKER